MLIRASLPGNAAHTAKRPPSTLRQNGSTLVSQRTPAAITARRDTVPRRRADNEASLWAHVARSGGQQLNDGFQAFQRAVQDAAQRVQRGAQPRPPGFPPGPPGDAAPSMLADPLAFLERTTTVHGGVAGVVLGGEYVVLVSDPAVAKDVLIDRAAMFVKEGTAFFPGSQLAGNGLLVSDGAVWRRQRQLSNPAFRSAAVKSYAEAMTSETQQMLSRAWRCGGRRDVYSDFNDLTLRITVGALFGATVDSQQARRVADSIETAFRFFADRTAAGISLPEWVPTPSNVAYRAAVSQLDAVIYQLIRTRRAELSASGRQPQDLLDNLLVARDEEGTGMTDMALRDELMTLLVAGQETSAILLAWAAALLAHHPTAQEEAAAEVDRVLGGRPPRAEDVKSLRCLEAVVLEAMRLRPPAYIVGRCASQPVSLGSFIISQGTTILVSPFIMHRDAACWEQPDEFLPQRWLQGLGSTVPEGQGLARTALAGMGYRDSYVPFGAGPRNCIGTGFAMMENVLVLAAILQKFRLRPLPGAPFPPAEPRITLRSSRFDLVLQKVA